MRPGLKASHQGAAVPPRQRHLGLPAPEHVPAGRAARLLADDDVVVGVQAGWLMRLCA